MSEMRGGVVRAVERGPARDAGLLPDDVVVAVDGTPVRDLIDWWWSTDSGPLAIDVLRDGAPIRLHVARSGGEPLGVTFSDLVFDGVRECDNACAFCFVSGLPRGLRPSLYVRDDDYRLSFLTGNFVTLTNLDDADIERIVAQRLSPLHVSVHAVDAEVRERLLCPTVEDRALELLDRLLSGGIEVHVQLVMVPGVNDGATLERTLEYLSVRSGVLSVGVVPMGHTAHQRRWTSSYDRESALALLADIGRWQRRMRDERGVGWVYAADELYLLASASIPSAGDYDGFPQFENGIGMVSAFLAELAECASGAGASPATAVTGELFAPVLRVALDRHGWTAVRVLPVHNSLFGGNVAVTGLLAGRDIVEAVRADGAEGTYLVPDVVVNSDGLLIDDVPARDLGALAGADVRVIGSDAGAFAAAVGIG